MKRLYQKLRDSAKGEDCTLQIFPYCNGNPETVVLCHISTASSSGMGLKAPDWFGVYGCSSCHDVIDLRVDVSSDQFIDLPRFERDALFRTWQRMIEKGLIKI
jgi:predicted CxxxxCH...CXXCH cytochrome family protein